MHCTTRSRPYVATQSCVNRWTPPLAGHQVARERMLAQQVGETYKHGPPHGP